jgi:hypothetical protein
VDQTFDKRRRIIWVVKGGCQGDGSSDTLYAKCQKNRPLDNRDIKIPGKLLPGDLFLEIRPENYSNAGKNAPKRQRFVVAGDGYRYNID